MARRPRRRPEKRVAAWTALPPAPPARLVGRTVERRTLARALRRVPVALLYGVGGIGKSALAYAVAARWPRVVVYRRVGEGDRARAVVDDLRRALAGGAIGEERDEPSALGALASASEEAGALLVIDDLHLLPPEEAAFVVDGLGRSLRRARLIATSRERLPRGGAPDRVELQLRPLLRAHAAVLWRSLDHLYGRSRGFASAFAQAAGNPLLLRQWHAGEVPSDDPIGELVGQLSRAERRAACMLAATPLRLPAAALVAALGRGGRAVVAHLCRKMIVEADATGLTVHDLLRPALLRALDRLDASAVHRAVAAILASLKADPVVRGREVVRQLCAARAWADAGAYLLGAAADFIRLGAARDLLHAYDAIPPQRRTRAVAVARARTLARAGSLADACSELERLQASGGPDAELDLALAQAAMLTGQLAVAAAAVERALAQRLAPEQLVRARTGRALILTHLDRGDEARAFLKAAEAATAQPKHRAHLALTRAFTLWLDERVGAGEAQPLIARARSLYEDVDGAYQAGALALPLVSAVLARQGRAGDALRALDQATPLLAGRAADVLLTQEVQFLRAAMALDLGRRREALELFVANEESFAARGNLLGARLAQVWRARVLLVLGRVAEARALLAEVSARSSALPSARRALERSHAYDPLVQLAAGDDATVPPALASRQRLFAALRAAAAGDAAGARRRLRGAAADTRGPGYALDRALVHLTRARLAEARGDRDGARLEQRRAEAEAADEADAGLVAQLGRAVGLAGDAERQAAVLDRGKQTLSWGGESIALGSRPALRRLLLVLAPGERVDKAALAAVLWGAAYKPTTHDNALWVNMMRLRKLLAPSGLTVQTSDDGYRLLAPAGLVVVGAER